jgi:hypothetical protein
MKLIACILLFSITLLHEGNLSCMFSGVARRATTQSAAPASRLTTLYNRIKQQTYRMYRSFWNQKSPQPTMTTKTPRPQSSLSLQQTRAFSSSTPSQASFLSKLYSRFFGTSMTPEERTQEERIAWDEKRKKADLILIQQKLKMPDFDNALVSEWQSTIQGLVKTYFNEPLQRITHGKQISDPGEKETVKQFINNWADQEIMLTSFPDAFAQKLNSWAHLDYQTSQINLGDTINEPTHATVRIGLLKGVTNILKEITIKAAAVGYTIEPPDYHIIYSPLLTLNSATWDIHFKSLSDQQIEEAGITDLEKKLYNALSATHDPFEKMPPQQAQIMRKQFKAPEGYKEKAYYNNNRYKLYNLLNALSGLGVLRSHDTLAKQVQANMEKLNASFETLENASLLPRKQNIRHGMPELNMRPLSSTIKKTERTPEQQQALSFLEQELSLDAHGKLTPIISEVTEI